MATARFKKGDFLCYEVNGYREYLIVVDYYIDQDQYMIYEVSKQKEILMSGYAIDILCFKKDIVYS